MKRILIFIIIILAMINFHFSAEEQEGMRPGLRPGGLIPEREKPDIDTEDTKEQDEAIEERPVVDLTRMHIRAGYYDYIDQDLLILKDNVEIKFHDIELYADRVEFYRQDNILIAEGNVLFRQDTDYINSSNMEINLSNNTGIIYDADGYISDAFYVKGDKIIKFSDRDYEFIRSQLSSCDESHRLWYFSSSGGIITREEYARLKNVILWFGGIPVFYLPYLVYPVRTERTTGFLVPSAGYSARRGWYIKNSFYWAISDYVDTTLSFDYYTKFGHVTTLEFRYVLGEGQAGTFVGLYSKEYENIFGEMVDEPTNKYSINYFHRHQINKDLNALLRIEYINVDNFYNQYGWSANYNTRNQINSFLSITHNTSKPRGTLLLLFDSRRDLREERGAEINKLPELKYDILRTRLFGDLFYTFSGTISNFIYRSRLFRLHEQIYTYEFKNDKAVRARSNLNLSYPLRISSFMTITPGINLFGAYYNRTMDIYDDNQNFFNEDLINKGEFIYNYDTSVSAEGPKFHRVFHFENSRLMHMIYPTFEYRYRPYTDIRTIPNLDGTDRIRPNNFFRYGISQKFFYRRDEEGKESRSREIASINIYQYYDRLKKELMPYSQYTPPRRSDKPQSDYYLDMNYYPSNAFRFKFSTRYDPYLKEMRSYNIDFGYYSSWFRSTINYSHHNIIVGDSFQDLLLNRSNRYVSTNTSIKIRDLIGLGISVSYDLEAEELRNGVFRIAYLHPCFSFQISAIKDISHFYRTHALDEWRYEFSFFFLNIGSVGSSDIPNDFIEEWGQSR